MHSSQTADAKPITDAELQACLVNLRSAISNCQLEKIDTLLRSPIWQNLTNQKKLFELDARYHDCMLSLIQPNNTRYAIEMRLDAFLTSELLPEITPLQYSTGSSLLWNLSDDLTASIIGKLATTSQGMAALINALIQEGEEEAEGIVLFTHLVKQPLAFYSLLNTLSESTWLTCLESNAYDLLVNLPPDMINPLFERLRYYDPQFAIRILKRHLRLISRLPENPMLFKQLLLALPPETYLYEDPHLINTFLHKISNHCPALLKLYLNAIPQKIIPYLLAEKDYRKWTGLHALINSHANVSLILYCLDQLSPKQLSDLLLCQASDGCTVLNDAAVYNERIFVELIQKTSSESLSAAVKLHDEDLHTVMELSLNHVSSKAMCLLLDKVDRECLIIFITNIERQQGSLKTIFNLIMDDVHWQNESLLNKLLDVGRALIPYAKDAFEAGLPLPQTLLQIISELNLNDFIPKIQGFITACIRTKNNEQSIQISTEEKISINDKDLHDHIFRHGLFSYSDYFLLRQLKKSDTHLMHILDVLMLNKPNRLFIGVPLTHAKYPLVKNLEVSQALDRVEQVLKAENLLIKIIAEHPFKSGDPNPWKQFLDQLINYNFRPPLREECDLSNATHKYLHKTGQVIEYKKHSAPKNKHYEHTKKMSTTLMPAKAITPLFGEHHKDRELVGLLFDFKQCKIKAMLAKDRGTYKRGWIGTLAKVLEYQRWISRVNFTDENKFRERVRNNPHKLNEVLAQISRESLLAIVIGRDTPEARSIATQRKKDVHRSLNIELPIVIYDRVCRSFKPLPSDQITSDHLEELILKHHHTRMTNEIISKRKYQIKSLWHTTPTTVRKLLSIATGKWALDEGFEAMGSVLRASMEKPNFFRTTDTKQFYFKLYKNYFSRPNENEAKAYLLSLRDTLALKQYHPTPLHRFFGWMTLDPRAKLVLDTIREFTQAEKAYKARSWVEACQTLRMHFARLQSRYPTDDSDFDAIQSKLIQFSMLSNPSYQL